MKALIALLLVAACGQAAPKSSPCPPGEVDLGPGEGGGLHRCVPPGKRSSASYGPLGGGYTDIVSLAARIAGTGLVASGGKLNNPSALDYAGTRFDFTDEFLYGNPNFSGGTGPWQRLASGTGTATTTLVSTATGSRIGIVSLATGSATTGYASFNLDMGMLDLTTLAVTSEATIGLTTASTGADEYEDFIGLADTNNTINLTNGCGFLYDRGNVATGGPNSSNEADWECVCANNGTRNMVVMDGTSVSDESFVTVAAPVLTNVTFPGTNGWTSLKVVITPGVRAEFYVAEGSGYVKSCDLTTDIPSTNARTVGPVLLHAKSAGTASRILELDRYHLEVDLPSARHL